MVFSRFGRRAFVSAAVWASIALRVGLRLGGGWARLERRSGWRLTGPLAESPSFWPGVAKSALISEDSVTVLEDVEELELSFAELCLGLKNDEVSLLW